MGRGQKDAVRKMEKKRNRIGLATAIGPGKKHLLDLHFVDLHSSIWWQRSCAVSWLFIRVLLSAQSLFAPAFKNNRKDHKDRKAGNLSESGFSPDR
ncbi:MAG: hypothetical protein AAB676_02655 [Verrucomicrobiota bacterium]